LTRKTSAPDLNMGKEKQTPNARASSGPDSPVDLKELERLMAFMAHHGLEELEYQRGAVHIRLRKPSQGIPAHSPQAVLHSIPASPAVAQGAGKQGSEAPTAALEATEHLHIVKSPIVGTFYEAPNPDTDPFVRVGDHVKAGQILCIIEAMKLMNEIETDCAGQVVRRLVENGQPVEYGQPLFALRPAP
jgi:acetyl-CoA carboxylase biotin carboxyl carrier protein